MMDNILGMKYGHEQMTAPTYYDFDKGTINTFKYFSRKNVNAVPIRHTFRTQAVVLMAGHQNAFPLLMNGYEMEKELKYSKLGGVLGKDFSFKSEFPLILGKRLARSLSVKEGDEVAVIGQGVDGSVANEIFKVEKILDMGGGEFEKNFAVTSLQSMQRLLTMQADDVHLLVNFGEPATVEKSLVKIKWQDLLPEIASSSGFMDRFTRFYAIFFALVASIAMANTLSLSFLERVKEYQMSTIIGAPVEWIKKTILLEIMFLSIASLITGNIIILTIIGYFGIFPLDLTLLSGGVPIQMGGIMLSQDLYLRPIGWIFLACNAFLILTLTIAAFYPLRVVLKKNRTDR